MTYRNGFLSRARGDANAEPAPRRAGPGIHPPRWTAWTLLAALVLAVVLPAVVRIIPGAFARAADAPAPAPALAPAPAPAPGAKPAAVKVDLSSPKAAARTLYLAVEAQDAAALRQVMEASTPEERQLVGSFVDLIFAGRKLRDSAKARWGGVGEELGVTMAGKEQLSNIEAGLEKRDGDEATLTVQGRATKYRQSNGQWRVVVTDYAHAKPEELPRQVELLKSLARVMGTTAEEIDAGRHGTPQEAEASIVTKYHQVMLNASPATQPVLSPTAPAATEPARPPEK